MSCIATILLFIILVICFVMGFYFMLIALLTIWAFVMGFVAYIWFREKLEEYRAKRNFKRNSKK
jgi:hypothetical protein